MTVAVNYTVAGGGGAGVSPAFANLTGNPTDNSALAASLDNVFSAYSMPGTVIDVARVEPNAFTCTATSHTLSFSATPSQGQEFALQLLGFTSACTITIPSCYSETLQATVTSFIVPANAKLTVFFDRDATVTRINGEQALLSDTWANIKVLTPAAGTEAFVNDVFGGRKMYYNGTRWRFIGNHVSAYSDGALYNVPNTTLTTEQLYAHAALKIPGGIMGPNDTVRVQMITTNTAETTGSTYRCRIDTVSTGITGTRIIECGPFTTSSTHQRTQHWRNANATNAQNMMVFPATDSGDTSTNTQNTTAQDTTADQYVKFTGQQGQASTGLPKLFGFSVEIIQGA